MRVTGFAAFRVEIKQYAVIGRCSESSLNRPTQSGGQILRLQKMEVPGTPTALESMSKLPHSQKLSRFDSALEAIAKSQYLRKPSEHTSCAIPVIHNILSRDHQKFDCALDAFSYGIPRQQLPIPALKTKKKSTIELSEKIRQIFEHKFSGVRPRIHCI